MIYPLLLLEFLLILQNEWLNSSRNWDFQRIKRLSLLAAQPARVISKNIKTSKVARIFGCHMNVQLKDAGERYLKEWLLTILDFDENGNKITVIDKIYSIGLYLMKSIGHQ